MSKIPKDIDRKLNQSAFEIDESFKANLKQQLFTKENTMPQKKSFNPVQFLKDYQSVPLYALIASLLVVGGVSATVANRQSQNARNEAIAIPDNLDGLVPLDTIQRQAQADEPSLSVVGIELENEDGTLIYKVEFSDGSYRLYDAATGNAVVAEDAFERDESVPSDYVAAVSLARARAIAQAERPGETITKIELETEEGVVVYSVRFSDDGRVDVDASTGDILRVRDGSDSDDDDSSDSRTETESSSSDDRSDDSRSDSSDDSSESDDDERDEAEYEDSDSDSDDRDEEDDN